MEISCPETGGGEEPGIAGFSAEQVETVRRMHDELLQHPEQRQTIEALARHCLMNPTTLKAVFKAVYGSPIYQYCKTYKMKAAAAMLISEPKLTVAGIAQRLGYDNASKFSAAFRDVMGVTPQNYRSRQEDL